MNMVFSGFDWDFGNRDKSLKKHGVTCAEAEQCFRGAHLIYLDALHSTDSEKRYVLFVEIEKKALFVSFTLRRGHLRSTHEQKGKGLV